MHKLGASTNPQKGAEAMSNIQREVIPLSAEQYNSIMQADMRERIAALEDALAHTIAKVIRLEEVLKP